MTIKLTLLLVLFIQGVFGQTKVADLSQLQSAFVQHPNEYTHYDNLHTLLTTQYTSLSPVQRNEIRNLLDQSTFSKIRNYPADEPGTRIIIRGKIIDKHSKAIAGARIVVFQTDHQGYYAPQDAKTRRMSETDARLYGALRTDAFGNYELRAIHPGTYPMKYENRHIPQHIHFNISAVGLKDLKLQVSFDDDPSMQDPYWRQWARDLEFPVVKLQSVNGSLTGNCDITLKE